MASPKKEMKEKIVKEVGTATGFLKTFKAVGEGGRAAWNGGVKDFVVASASNAGGFLKETGKTYAGMLRNSPKLVGGLSLIGANEVYAEFSGEESWREQLFGSDKPNKDGKENKGIVGEVKEKFNNAKDSVVDYIKENPLKSLAGGGLGLFALSKLFGGKDGGGAMSFLLPLMLVGGGALALKDLEQGDKGFLLPLIRSFSPETADLIANTLGVETQNQATQNQQTAEIRKEVKDIEQKNGEILGNYGSHNKQAQAQNNAITEKANKDIASASGADSSAMDKLEANANKMPHPTNESVLDENTHTQQQRNTLKQR